MFSLIIASTDKTKRREYIQKFCQEHSIDRFDITIIDRESAIKQNVASIGIEEIKNMQKKLYLKPLKSPTKAVILEDAELLTTQAQNAMLKVLEEPPNNTIIILSASSKEAFLATIISRCQIIELIDERKKLTEKEIKEFSDFIENLPKMTIGEKFKKAETLSKDKDKATEWITGLILILRERLLETIKTFPSPFRRGQGEVNGDIKNLQNKKETEHYAFLIQSFQQAHTLLKNTNVNPRFLLENTLLTISH